VNARLLSRYLGLGLVCTIVLVAIFAPWLATNDPNSSSSSVLAMPSSQHLFGTDALGRDAYSRVLYGARASLVIGIAASIVGMLIGVPVGLIAGYIRGRFDFVTVQFIDIFVALPPIVMAMIFTAVVGTSLQNLIVVLGVLKWAIIARIIRGQVISLREQAFVEAARAVGCTTSRILIKHIAPNIMRIVAAQFAVVTSASIFTAASLSYLGLGLPPPTPDWGGMVQSGFDYLFLNPLLSLAPGVAVTLTVIGFYVIGRSYE
jgi:peptide/nickel transport system permease protein